METIRDQEPEAGGMIEARWIMTGECFEYALSSLERRVFMRLNEHQYGKVRGVDVQDGTVIVISDDRLVRRRKATIRVA